MTRGVGQIVRFNWPFYASAAACACVAAALTVSRSLPLPGRFGVTAVGAAATFWMVASLVASWIVYDRSPLTRWHWIRGAVERDPRVWINVTAGFDQSTRALQSLFGAATGRVLDVFDSNAMTAPSIGRARSLARDSPIERADFRRLPCASGTIGAAFLLLSAHELRRAADRDALFGELRRIIAPDGTVLVAEHLRDLANVIAFGPGALHFHSRRTWLRAFSRGRFAIASEFSITPFVRVFVLRRLQ
jgi:hypothetical protein